MNRDAKKQITSQCLAVDDNAAGRWAARCRGGDVISSMLHADNFVQFTIKPFAEYLMRGRAALWMVYINCAIRRNVLLHVFKHFSRFVINAEVLASIHSAVRVDDTNQVP